MEVPEHTAIPPHRDRDTLFGYCRTHEYTLFDTLSPKDMTPRAKKDLREIDVLSGVEAVVSVIQKERDSDILLSEICEKLIKILRCDRAWLLYPCDPSAESWQVPVERTVPEYPGASESRLNIEMTPDVSEIFRTALSSEFPVIYGPEGLPLAESTKRFGVKSQLSMAIFPRVGKPWQFGIHQCTHDRIWNADEVKLFRIIGVLTAEALGNILLVHDLKEANETLERRVSDRTAELRAERDLAESVIETAQIIVLLLNPAGQVVRFNKYMEKLTRYTLDAEKGNDWINTFIADQDRDRIRMVFQSVLKEVPQNGIVNEIKTKDGLNRTVEWYNQTLKDQNGNISFVLSIGHDITKHIEVEEKLRASLGEKDILLREIHHRVKNNLQIVSGLLSLQAIYAHSSDIREALKESGRRIQLMAQIHEKLYRSSDFAHIRFDSFVRSLVNDMVSSYGKSGHHVSIETYLESVSLDIDRAIPCGQIISELVSNCLKHAFPNHRAGRIEVSLVREESEIVLSVVDDGIGLPYDLTNRRLKSLGLQIVEALAKQLEGTLEVSGHNGTRWRISFRE